jgi:addiction module HigA family antidote
MEEFKVRRPLGRAPTHPGELMREILTETLRLPIAEAARRMEISRQSLHAVLSAEASVTADMALRFAKLVGGAPELYLRMQDNHDLWHARRRLAPMLARIERAAAE